jgi:integrase
MSSTTPEDERPKVESRRRHRRPEEASKLIAAAGKRGRYPDCDKLLLRLAYRHALRASEAVGLRWDSFDLDGGSLTIGRGTTVMTAFHTACHRVRIYGHPCSAIGKIPYMDATGAFLDCYVIPWGRPSEEPGHR